MATVYQRANSPFWYYDMTDPVTGVRKRVSTKRTAKREAQQVADAALRKRQDQKQLGVTEEVTLGVALDRYVEAQRARKVAGWHNTEHLAGKLTGKIPGKWRIAPDTPLVEITTRTVETLVTKRLGEGYAPNTVNHEVALLRGAYRAARKSGCAVAPDVEFKLAKVTQKTRYLTGEEFEALYRELDPDTPIRCSGEKFYVATGGRIRADRQDAQDILVALALTGGRWGEIAKLTWDMVDMIDYSTIRLYGWKDREERAVPVAELVRAMFQRRRARMAGTIYVFPGRGGDRPRFGPCRAIGRAMQRCGLNAPHLVERHGRATIHSLRHTFASWTLQNGASLAEVQNLLGHADPSMTRRYAHLEQSHVVAKAAAIMDKMTRGVMRPLECDASVPPPAEEAEATI